MQKKRSTKRAPEQLSLEFRDYDPRTRPLFPGLAVYPSQRSPAPAESAEKPAVAKVKPLPPWEDFDRLEAVGAPMIEAFWEAEHG